MISLPGITALGFSARVFEERRGTPRNAEGREETLDGVDF